MADEEKDVNNAGSSTAEVIDAEPETPAPDAAKPAEAIKTDKPPQDAEGQKIPYDRFQEVVGERNEAQRLAREYEAQLNEFRNKQTAVPPVPQKPRFEDPATQAFYEATIAPLEKQAKEAFELAKETRAQAQAGEWATAMMKEIDGLMVHHPKADKEWVINTLIGNPKSKIADLVKYSHNKEDGKEKTFLANYIKTKQEEAKHKAKSPAGGAPAAKMPDNKGKSWNEQIKGAEATFKARLSASED